MIQLNSVSKSFHQGATEILALNNVDLKISQGEQVAILGPSGSGKTTLLSLMSALEKPNRGKVLFENKSLGDFSEAELSQFRSHSMGIVFQQFHLVPHLTALENVTLATEVAGHSNPEQLSKDFLTQVGLGERLNHLPSQLSGGEQQRVAIARAFAKKPKIVFADEPSGNLDQKTGEKIIDIIFNQSKESGCTLVIVTHDLKLAERCQRIIRISNGSIQ